MNTKFNKVASVTSIEELDPYKVTLLSNGQEKIAFSENGIHFYVLLAVGHVLMHVDELRTVESAWQQYRIQKLDGSWLDDASMWDGENFFVQMPGQEGHKLYTKSELRTIIPKSANVVEDLESGNSRPTVTTGGNKTGDFQEPIEFIKLHRMSPSTIAKKRLTQKQSEINLHITTTFPSTERDLANPIAVDRLSELERYNISLPTGNPVGVATPIFAINSGSWIKWLLAKRLAGERYTLTMVANRDLKNMGGIPEKVRDATFAWANAEHSFFLKVYGDKGKIWGLKTLGLEIDLYVKSAKRLQEISRTTQMSLYQGEKDPERFYFCSMEDMDRVEAYFARIVVASYETPAEVVDYWQQVNKKLGVKNWEDKGKKEADLLFDGGNEITMDMAILSVLEQPKSKARDELIRHIRNGIVTRLNVRLLWWDGLVKGDAAIVAGRDQLDGADFRYHVQNLKTELKTTGKWVLFTAMNHAPIHEATWDDQSTINNGVGLPVAHQLRDIKTAVTNIQTMTTTGTPPDFMKLASQKAHTGTPNLRQASDDMKQDHIRWFRAGLDFHDCENFPQMWIGGKIREMEPGWDAEKGYYTKTQIRMSNAVNAGIFSYSFAKHAGIEMSHNPMRPFLHERYGMILPDQRYIETFHLHGTHDQDDVTDYIMIKVWSSSKKAVSNLVKDFVLDSGIEVPTKKEDAIILLLAIRSPNGPGEYSIEFGLEDYSLFSPGLDEDITVVDLAHMPRGQSHLLSLVETQTGLPPKDPQISFGKPMTRDDALYMIEAQITNVGIGGSANFSMVYVDTEGVQFPPVITAPIGTMVDATQQDFDKPALAVIARDAEKGFKQLLSALEADPTKKVDRRLAATRGTKDFNHGLDLLGDRLHDGRMTGISREYRHAYVTIKAEMSDSIKEARCNGRLFKILWGGDGVKGLGVGPSNPGDDSTDAVYDWAKNFYFAFDRDLNMIGERYKKDFNDNLYVRMSRQYNMKLDLQHLVKAKVTELEAMPDTNRRIIALVKWIMKPTHPSVAVKAPFGMSDRIIFQSGGEEGKSLMDLFISAMTQCGAIEPVE